MAPATGEHHEKPSDDRQTEGQIIVLNNGASHWLKITELFKERG